jgi:membrane protease YdiL (CAAX protease family)
MSEIHPLHAAFVRRPIVTAVAVTIASSLLTGAGRAGFGALLPDGPHRDQLAAGFQQTSLAMIVIALLWRMRWLNASGVTSRPRWPATWWPFVILPAGLIPLAGLVDTNRHATAQIVASTFDFVSTGVVEELVFRALVLTGLCIGLAGRRRDRATIVGVNAILFGIPHINPVGIVFAAVFGLAFVHLAISTNTIWIGVVVHACFDLFTDLPDSTAGITGGWYIPAALLFVLLGAITAVVRLHRNSPEFADARWLTRSTG